MERCERLRAQKGLREPVLGLVYILVYLRD
jgi:hypothetical protein